MLTYVEEEWLNIEGMLTQERGIWGPYNETSLTKWMLDMTEVSLYLVVISLFVFRTESLLFNFFSTLGT